MALRRLTLSFINASFITILLFAFMYSLIDIGEAELSDVFSMPKVVFVHVPEDETVTVLVPKEERPELVDAAPDMPVLDTEFIFDDIQETTWEAYKRDPIKGGDLLPRDRQLIIAMGFPPEYPRGAISRGTEGYAIVGFSVDKSGSVINPYIIESEPGSVFDRSALKGIMKFKYKARTVDGRPVVTDGQQYRFTYQMEN